MNFPPVAVTGIGWAGPAADPQAWTEGLRTGRSWVRPLPALTAAACPVTAGAPAEFPGDNPPGCPGRVAAMARHAAAAALAQSGWPRPPADLECFVALGIDQPPDSFWRECTPGTASPVAPSNSPGRCAPWLARSLGLPRLPVPVQTACTGSTQSIVEACRAISLGQCHTALAGGADSRLHPAGIWGYAPLGVLASDPHQPPETWSRPFDRRRLGFVIGEGAAFLVLESLSSARARGAPVVAELIGWAAAADAWRITDPDPDAAAGFACLERCFARAGLTAAETGWVSAHATGTPKNDAAEAALLSRFLGPRAPDVPVTALKSNFGHAGTACGALELVAALLHHREGFLPPILNLRDPAPEAARLGLVRRRPVPSPSGPLLKLSFGFGGHVAALLVRSRALQFPSQPTTSPD